MFKYLLKKFGGVLFFYLSIVGMIMIINYRFSSLNEESDSSLAININEKATLE